MAYVLISPGHRRKDIENMLMTSYGYHADEISYISGVIGVPLTFLDSYCPKQFDIAGMCENKDIYGLKTRIYSRVECKQRYEELFGKPGSYDLNASGVIKGIKTYARVLIRRHQLS